MRGLVLGEAKRGRAARRADAVQSVVRMHVVFVTVDHGLAIDRVGVHRLDIVARVEVASLGRAAEGVSRSVCGRHFGATRALNATQVRVRVVRVLRWHGWVWVGHLAVVRGEIVVKHTVLLRRIRLCGRVRSRHSTASRLVRRARAANLMALVRADRAAARRRD